METSGNFKDIWATGEDGQQFVFTVEMQRELSQAGLPVEPASLSQLEKREVVEREDRHGRDDQYGRRVERSQREEAPPPAGDSLEPESIQIDPETGKYLGRMKWYNPARGYGFISRGGGLDIFFHKTSTIGDPTELEEGQWILYDVEERKKGPEATDVEPYLGDLVS